MANRKKKNQITLTSSGAEDAALKETEKKIREIYTQAEKEIEEKLKAHLKRYSELDLMKRNELYQLLKDYQRGVIPYKDYTAKKKAYEQWRIGQMMTGSRWEALRDTIATDLANASKIAESVINGHISEAYYLNFNTIMYQFETETLVDTFMPIYNQYSVEYIFKNNPSLLPQYKLDIPKTLQWNKQKISSAILQGILQGESMNQVAKRLRTVTNMEYNASIRNARTASGSAANKGKLDSFKTIQNMGFNIKKQWISTLDGRTRHEHRLLMGQTVNLGEPFKINGYELEYPCDPSAIKNPLSELETEKAVNVIQAAPEMIYNCRCVIVGIIEGYEKTIEDFEYQKNPKLNGMSLEEWKNAKPVYKRR